MIVFVVACLAIAVTAASDYYWTELVVRAGGREINPVLARYMTTPLLHALAKAVLTAGICTALGFAWRRDRASALVVAAIVILAFTAAARHNMRVYGILSPPAPRGC